MLRLNFHTSNWLFEVTKNTISPSSDLPMGAFTRHLERVFSVRMVFFHPVSQNTSAFLPQLKPTDPERGDPSIGS